MAYYSKLVTLIISVCVITSFSGCGQILDNDYKNLSTNTKVINRTEVDLALAAYDPEVPGWTAVIEAANKELENKNITIKINKFPTSTWEPYYQKILTLMAAGNAPDIGRIAESYMPILIQKSKVVNITDQVKEIDMSKYYEYSFKGAASYNGGIYGVPCGIYTMLLYYNKDLFDKAGLKYPSSDWNNPITWNEFSKAAKSLTKGNGRYKIFGAHINLDIFLMNQYLYGNAGRGLYDEQGNCVLGDAKNVQLLDVINNMFIRDKSLAKPVDAKIIGYWDMFKSGRIAMMIDGTWFHPAAKSIIDFKPGIAALPSNTGKSVTTSFLDAWVIYSGAKHPKESWEAIKAIISDESFNALAPYGVGGIPATKSTVQKFKEVMVGSQFDTIDQKAFIDSMEHTISASYTVNVNEFLQDWNYGVEQWSLGKLSTKEFVKKEMEVITEGNNLKR